MRRARKANQVVAAGPKMPGEEGVSGELGWIWERRLLGWDASRFCVPRGREKSAGLGWRLAVGVRVGHVVFLKPSGICD